MMKVAYILTPRLRVFLKEPFGTLIKGSPEVTMAKFRDAVQKEKPPMVISVGDIVSQNLHECGLNPQLTVIDYISLRDQAMPKQAAVEKTVYVQNPQGTITEEAIETIEKALQSRAHTHVVVDGEEDLLTLVAVLFAPENSFIVYGQPHCGIVVVKASQSKKAEVKEFLKEMKASKS
jgi:GTP-dependent dephospho-CoA kinase